MNPMKAFVVIVSGIPILAGILLLITTFQDSMQAEQASSWQQTHGVIVQEMRHAGFSMFSAYPRERYDSFTYRYQVAGTTYESNRVGFSAFAFGKEYRGGEQVVVYYDPQRPGEAALEVGLGVAELLSYAIGFGLIGVGTVLRRRLAKPEVQRTPM